MTPTDPLADRRPAPWQDHPLLAILPFCLGTILYLLLVAPHSYHLSDDGWILAMAYRLVHGDVPYRDFIFAFPPASPFLHSIWMAFPDSVQFMAARSGFYLAFLLMPAALFVFTYRQCFPERRDLAATACLTGVAWAYALHNFPPMPWPTVDGLLLGTLALTLLIASVGRSGRQKALYGVAAGVLAGICALTKQSFAPFFAYFLLAAAASACRREPNGMLRVDWAHGVRVVAAALAPMAVFVLYLEHHGILLDAIKQIVGVATSKGLEEAVVVPYRWSRFAQQSQQFAWIGLGLAVIGSVPRRFAGLDLRAVPYLFFLGQLLWNQRHYFTLGGMETSYHLFACISAFMLGRLLILAITRQLRLELALLVTGTWVLAFAVQISWGYHVPILGFGGLGFALAALTLPPVNADGLSRRSLFYALPFGLALVMGIGISRAAPYRDVPVAAQTRDLSTLSDRFPAGFTTGEPNYHRMQTLMALADDLERRFPDRQPVVITEAPLFYYLRHRHNPTPIDWWLPEQSGVRAGRMLLEMQRPDVVVIVRRDFVPNALDPRDRFMALAQRRGLLVGSAGAYDAYIVPPGGRS